MCHGYTHSGACAYNSSMGRSHSQHSTCGAEAGWRAGLFYAMRACASNSSRSGSHSPRTARSRKATKRFGSTHAVQREVWRASERTHAPVCVRQSQRLGTRMSDSTAASPPSTCRMCICLVCGLCRLELVCILRGCHLEGVCMFRHGLCRLRVYVYSLQECRLERAGEGVAGEVRFRVCGGAWRGRGVGGGVAVEGRVG